MSEAHPAERIDDLSKEELLKLFTDFMHRILVHYALSARLL
jgi:hypothetical protein